MRQKRVENNSNSPTDFEKFRIVSQTDKGRETCKAMVKKVGADHTDDVSRKQGNGR